MTDNCKIKQESKPSEKTGKSFLDRILLIDVILFVAIMLAVSYCAKIMITYW